MEQFNMYFHQITNICIWFNKNSKISANILYDGLDNSLHVDLSKDKERIYAQHVGELDVRSEKIINLEMNRLIGVLLQIKQEVE